MRVKMLVEYKDVMERNVCDKREDSFNKIELLKKKIQDKDYMDNAIELIVNDLFYKNILLGNSIEAKKGIIDRIKKIKLKNLRSRIELYIRARGIANKYNYAIFDFSKLTERQIKNLDMNVLYNIYNSFVRLLYKERRFNKRLKNCIVGSKLKKKLKRLKNCIVGSKLEKKLKWIELKNENFIAIKKHDERYARINNIINRRNHSAEKLIKSQFSKIKNLVNSNKDIDIIDLFIYDISNLRNKRIIAEKKMMLIESREFLKLYKNYFHLSSASLKRAIGLVDHIYNNINNLNTNVKYMKIRQAYRQIKNFGHFY
jgi:hypothetical protein